MNDGSKDDKKEQIEFYFVIIEGIDTHYWGGLFNSADCHFHLCI